MGHRKHIFQEHGMSDGKKGIATAPCSCSCVQTGFHSHQKETSLLPHHKANIWGVWSNVLLETGPANRCSSDWAAWPRGILGDKEEEGKREAAFEHLANYWVEIFWCGFAWQPAAQGGFYISEKASAEKVNLHFYECVKTRSWFNSTSSEHFMEILARRLVCTLWYIM